MDQFGLFASALSLTSNLVPFFENEYQRFSSFLGFGIINDPLFGRVNHFSIEDKLEAEHHQYGTDPFYRTQHYHVNDLKDANGNHYQYKEMPAGKKILFMCGIGNTFKDFKESMVHISEIAGGYNVEGIFCPTFGLPVDYKTYDQALRKKACFEGTRLFQDIVREFNGTQPAGATMLVIPHSRACAYTRNGLIDSTQEERNRIDVRAFAPGAYIDRSLCKSVVHYVSKRDIVPTLDRVGRERCKDTIIMLQPHPKAPLNDHPVISPTYTRRFRREFEIYMEN